MELELAIWREACQHLDIEESLSRMLKVIARFLPIESIAALGIDVATRTLVPLAAAGPAIVGVPRGKLTLEKGSFEELLGLFALKKPLVTGGPLTFEPLPRPRAHGTLWIGPLSHDEEGPLGVVVMSASAPFDAERLASARALLSPFQVALKNDRRLHELARLREAALADNQALLSRLSRQSIVESIVGERGGLRPVMERVAQVASTDVPVLLLGETGSGKEVIARAIHDRSRRHAGPMVRVNCGAIPSELIDSELFGHERGSFTGAVAAKKGWFERADGGTLLLDEVGELSLAAQVRLLRILQEGTLERVGGQRTLHLDVRIVAATHRDLHAMVEDGRFREDLWYRLSVFPLRLPSLRERREDIPALAAHFAAQAGIRLGAGPLVPSHGDLDLLLNYPWPGNVRELAAVIERAAILGHGRTLAVAAALGAGAPIASHVEPRSFAGARANLPTRDLGIGLAPQDPPPSAAMHLHDGTGTGAYPSPYGAPPYGPPLLPSPAPPQSEHLDQAMRRHIESALAQTHGRIEGPRGAAARLNINPHTLRSRMRKLGIDWARFR